MDGFAYELTETRFVTPFEGEKTNESCEFCSLDWLFDACKLLPQVDFDALFDHVRCLGVCPTCYQSWLVEEGLK